MNYKSIAKKAAAGIKFFSDPSAGGSNRKMFIPSEIEYIDGYEVLKPESEFDVTGIVRQAKVKDIDGESIMKGDYLGVFNADVEIKSGYFIVIDGQRFAVSDPRPIRPSGVTVAYRPILRMVAING